MIEDCQEIVDDNPGSPLSDKMADVCAKAQAALDDTAKGPAGFHVNSGGSCCLTPLCGRRRLCSYDHTTTGYNQS